MTAREKFIARLKELGIYEQWLCDNHVGAVLPDGSVVVLVHIDKEPADAYTEIHYPPFEEIRKKPEDIQKLKEEFYTCGNDEFVAKLAYWLDFPDSLAECPLFPVDLYWARVDDDHWFDYQDDPDTNDTRLQYLRDTIEALAEKWGVEIKAKLTVGDKMTEI